MPFRIAGLIFFLLTAALPAADQLQTGGVRVEGTILGRSTTGCVLVKANGQTATYKDASIHSLDLGTDAVPRWARVVVEGEEKARVLRVVSCKDGVLHCRDGKDKSKDLRLGNKDTVELYHAAMPVRQLKVPHVKQKPDYCGEACIEMVTSYFGEPVSQDRVNEVAGLKGARGCYGRELVRVIDESLRLETAGRVHRACRSAADHLWDRVSLVRALSLGRPVLLGVWGSPEQKHNEERWTFDHFVLLTGYDLERGRFLINNPGYASRDQGTVSFARFTAHRENKFGGLFHIEFPPWRTWTHGERRLRAQFVNVEDGKVRLRGRDGREVSAPVKELSKADQTVIERLRMK